MRILHDIWGADEASSKGESPATFRDSTAVRTPLLLSLVPYLPLHCSIIVFAILRLLHIKDYVYRQNSTFTGVPTAVFGLLAMYASLTTATTPLLKSFLLEFKIMRNSAILLTMGPKLEESSRSSEHQSRSEHKSGSDQSYSETKTSSTAADPVPGESESMIARGSTRSKGEPWTLRYDCEHAKTRVTSPSSLSESQDFVDGEDGIRVQRSFNVCVRD